MRFKFRNKAHNYIRHSPGVVTYINTAAEVIADHAAELSDGNYGVSPYDGRKRHRASVMAHGRKTILDNKKNNTLLKALDAGS